MIADLRHYLFAVLSMRWPDRFVRCYECDRWETYRRAQADFTPDTYFTAEQCDWYCRTCKGRR